MRSELSDVLERSAERPTAEPDFADLARRGRRRRYAQRTTQGLAVVAVIALTAGVVLPRLRPPEVMFDSGPRGGVGTWENIPPAPIGSRMGAQAFADDDHFVVFSGAVPQEDGQSAPNEKDGAVYFRERKAWEAIPAAPFLGPAEFANGRLIVMNPNGRRAALYDIDSRKWTITPPSPVGGALSPLWQWTGEGILVWGVGASRSEGALWRESTGTWTVIPRSPVPARDDMAVAWTGRELVVWGGGTGNPMKGTHVAHGDGARFDVKTNTWQALPPSPLSPRVWPEAVWDGSRVVILGGESAEELVGDPSNEVQPSVQCDESGSGLTSSGSCGMEMTVTDDSTTSTTYHDGAAFDPATNEWAPIASAPSARRRLPFLIGDRLAARKGSVLSLYDTERDKWIPHPTAPPDDATVGVHYAVGSHLVTINTDDRWIEAARKRVTGYALPIGGDRWDPLSEADVPRRLGPAVAVTDDALFLWGGQETLYAGPGREPPKRTSFADGAIVTLD